MRWERKLDEGLGGGRGPRWTPQDIAGCWNGKRQGNLATVTAALEFWRLLRGYLRN